MFKKYKFLSGNSINKDIPRHIVIKLQNTRDEENFRAAKEKSYAL